MSDEILAANSSGHSTGSGSPSSRLSAALSASTDAITRGFRTQRLIVSRCNRGPRSTEEGRRARRDKSLIHRAHRDTEDRDTCATWPAVRAAMTKRRRNTNDVGGTFVIATPLSSSPRGRLRRPLVASSLSVLRGLGG